MKRNLIKSFYKITFVILLTSCSSINNPYLGSILEAHKQQQDAVIPIAQIHNSTVDYLYVQQDQGRIVAMALAFIDNGIQTWVGSDRSSLQLDYGRILATDYGNQDLLFVGNAIQDPLKLNINEIANKHWNSFYDIEPQSFGNQVTSQFGTFSSEKIDFATFQVDTLQVAEIIYFNQQPLQNLYWFSVETGELVKSTQQISPTSPKLTMIFASRLARIIKANGGSK